MTTEDLSSYELERLANIRKNQAELQKLGLSTKVDAHIKKLQGQNKSSRIKPETKRMVSTPPTRFSKRIRGIKPLNTDFPDYENKTEKTTEIDYSVIPIGPEQLDDYEFQIYIRLKRVRLERTRELGIEPYKLCQNRTLCDLVRRKRNDNSFALGTGDKIKKDLLLCWGIGPSKVNGCSHSEKGFANELNDILKLPEMDCEFDRSRQQMDPKTQSNSDSSQ